jgi:integrase/recombinase XerD
VDEEVVMRDPSRVLVIGPLAEYSTGICGELARCGYSPDTAARHLQLMASASRWLASERLAAGEFTPERVERFVVARGEAGYRSELRPDRLVGYLRSVGAAPEPVSAGGEGSGSERLLERYRGYLVRERNLAALTVRPYMRVARVFVSSLSRAGELDMQHVTAAEVSRFVLVQSRGRSAGSARNVTVMLRSLLRFLHVEGVCGDLTGAVPAVAPHARSLPRSVEARTVERLLASCDQSTRTGRRDYAIVLLLARLGLRAGEVAAVELSDVDWRAGEMVVRGKGDRWERVPVPVDVGEALADYVQAGRPRTRDGRLFMRVHAPITGLSRDGVNGVVEAACRRCELPVVGPHALRHTLAVEVLRRGGSLAEIGELLRQRSEFTTAIYAKVDRAALGELARPWPGGGS